MKQGSVADVPRVGGWLMVTPHVDPEALRRGRRFKALKIFLAEGFSPAVLWAWRSMFPAGIRFLPVGGISAGTFSSWLEAGATGFGIGSALYWPGRSAEEVHAKAREFINKPCLKLHPGIKDCGQKTS